jgi:hypothetical protein
LFEKNLDPTETHEGKNSTRERERERGERERERGEREREVTYSFSLAIVKKVSESAGEDVVSDDKEVAGVEFKVMRELVHKLVHTVEEL